MSRKINTSTNLYAFLKDGGYLDKGEEHIKLGKKLYRKQYLRERKSYYRSIKREVTLLLNNEEEALLQRSADEKGLTLPDYLRSASKAYAAQVFLTPRHPSVVSLRQEVILTRTQISRIAKQAPGIFGKSRDAKIEELLQSLEAMMRQAFQTPQDLETVVRASLSSQPKFVERLKQIISEHDH